MEKEKKTRKPRTKKSEQPQVVPTPLTLEHIVSDDAKYNEQITVTFDDGRYTTIYKYFRPQLIESILEEFSEFLIDFEKAGNIIAEKEVDLYLKLHIVMKFSTIIGVYPNDIHEKLEIIRIMADNNLVKKIFYSFDENEIAKVYEAIYQKFEDVQKMMKHNQEMRKQLRERIEGLNLENKDVILGSMNLGESDNG